VVFTFFILWMMIGGEFAPRAQLERIMSQSHVPRELPAYLSFYFLGALALGYFIGYCLLVFGVPEPQRHRRRQPPPNRLLQAFAAVPALAALGVAVYLAWTNAPVVRLNNGQLLKTFTTRTVGSLPSEPAVVLSDRPRILTLVHTLLSQQDLSDRHLLVNTRGLAAPVYQQDLNERAPHLWPDYFTGTNAAQRQIPDAVLMLELTEVALKNPTYYLHPSFGYFFERLYLEPRGTIYQLQHWATNVTALPPLSPELLESNTQSFRALGEELSELTQESARTSPDARTVANWYSQALNFWGVTLVRQASGQLEPAAEAFQLARDLNPDNRSAEINLAFAQARLSGQARSAYEGKTPEQMFGKRYRSWDQLLSIDGPIDDPAVCLSLGQHLLGTSLSRQAIVELQRSIALSPVDQQQLPRFLLAAAYSRLGQFEKVLAVAEEIHEHYVEHPLPQNQRLRLFTLEAVAMRERDQNITAAEQYLRQKIAEFPGSIVLIDTLGELYVGDQQEDKALALVDEQLAQLPSTPASRSLRHSLGLSKAAVCMKIERFDDAETTLEAILSQEPNHSGALAYQGYLYLTREMYTNAIPVYDRLVALRPDDLLPHLNRAIALLKSGQLDAAESDYLKVVEIQPQDHRAYFGLGEIAWTRKDYKEAAKHYEDYLRFTRQPDNQEARDVEKRLKSIESGDL
jgi:tetratricopeptide (TPR) repeat protein